MATGRATAAARALNAVFANNGFVGSPPVITAGDPPDGQQGTVYDGYAFAASGATPQTWSVPSGVLPPGVALNAAGALTGTPTLEGTYVSTVRVQNLFGFATIAVSITITAVAGSGTTTPPNDITVGIGASRVGYFYSVERIMAMSNAEFIQLRDVRGINDLVVGFGYPIAGGDYSGDYHWTTDTSATFSVADGRRNPGEYGAYDKWTVMRGLKYGNAGQTDNLTGYGAVIPRLHALGMRFFCGGYIGSQAFSSLFMPWFDDAKWANMLAPTSGFATWIAAAHAWGWDGLMWDDECFGNIPDHGWDWSNATMGAGNTQPVVRAKAFQRGGEVGALIALHWTTRKCIFKKYQTTGHAGPKGDYDGDIGQLGNDPTGNIKLKYVERDFDSGLLASAANMRLDVWQSAFYRGATNGGVMYEVVNTIASWAQYVGIAQWSIIAPKLTRNAFMWPGHASTAPEDYPMSVPQSDAAFAAAHRNGQQDCGYYYQTGDDSPYDAGMRAAASLTPVSNAAPTFTSTPTVIAGVCTAHAQHPHGIVAIRLQVFNAGSTAIASTWHIPHNIVNGAHDYTSAFGADDATYNTLGQAVPGGVTAGRACWVTAVSAHGQEHTVLVTAQA